MEVARKAAVWTRDAEHPERPAKPRSLRVDILGVADLLAMMPDGRRCLIQVTTIENVGSHRRRFLQARFPVTPDDAILAHEQGRRFRELRGPDFAMPGRTLLLPALPKKPKNLQGDDESPGPSGRKKTLTPDREGA